MADTTAAPTNKPIVFRTAPLKRINRARRAGAVSPRALKKLSSKYGADAEQDVDASSR
jgi:hypothetical protein